MNRKQRRAGLKQAQRGQSAAELYAEALRLQQQNKLDDAARAYKRLLLINPDHGEASNNLACILQAQGKVGEASARFAHTLELVPQLLTQFSAILRTLTTLLPPLAEAMRRADIAWPQRLPLSQMLDDRGVAALSADPLLLAVLRSTPVRNVALERMLTSLRSALLERAGARDAHAHAHALAFCCALAQQCFINEYVFATAPAEEAQVEQLKNNLQHVTPVALAALAMYLPLHALPDAQTLLDRKWPPDVDNVVTQQMREPLQERALRDSIPRLTAIEDDVSLSVQQQYEENPYPRWVHVAGNVEAQSIDEYLRAMLPAATWTPLDKTDELDVLVAGCGTGSHPIELTRKIANAKILAVDLSMSSLAYAKRMTPPEIAGRLTYGQADILELGILGRRFDVIDASGVLHHMADVGRGLRSLVALLRGKGLMHIGLYSESARRDVTAARKYVAEKGYSASAYDIRRARQDILASHLRTVARADDFFSTSECRDLLFHVQEHQLTIPKIKSLLAENALTFVGFVSDPPRATRYASWFAQRRLSLSDLDAWHEYETQNPDTFAAMYQFWVQRAE